MSTGTVHRTRRPTTPLIDPRLRDRRIEVARDQGRRRLRRILAVVAVLVVVAGLVALTRSPVLDVDRVTVAGAANTDAATVRKVAAVRLRSPMVDLDAGAVEDRLEALPWVARASVHRRWPGTVAVTIVERTPVAVVGEGSAAVLVDARGRALGPAAQAQGLAAIAGRPTDPGGLVAAPTRVAIAVVAGLPSDLRRQVARATPDGSATILTLDDGITVRWGDRTQATAKADALRVVLDKTDRSGIAAIDVTVPRATTVTPS